MTVRCGHSPTKGLHSVRVPFYRTMQIFWMQESLLMPYKKSPIYAAQFRNNSPPTEQQNYTQLIANQINNLMPNVKLFMFVSDPVDRMFSHIKDCLKTNRLLFESNGITHTVFIIRSLNFSSIVFEVVMCIVKYKQSKVSSNWSQIISNTTKRHILYTKLLNMTKTVTCMENSQNWFLWATMSE